jgi:hypothetical protein
MTAFHRRRPVLNEPLTLDFDREVVARDFMARRHLAAACDRHLADLQAFERPLASSQLHERNMLSGVASSRP